MSDIKTKVLNCYSRVEPKVFAHFGAHYDEESHKIITSSNRTYELRAGEPIQLLIKDETPVEIVLEFLEKIKTHITVFGMPQGPVQKPDGTDL